MSFKRRYAAWSLVAVLSVGLSSRATAQATTALTGVIVDTVGAPIAGARIRMPQLERFVTADSAGRFRVAELRAGRIVVVAEAPGYFGTRAEVELPDTGEVTRTFALRPNAHVLSAVEVRARARRQLPMKLTEFSLRQARGMGRFLGPEQMTRFDGQPLTEALKTIVTGARFERNSLGQMTIVSARSLNVPTSLRTNVSTKSCGVQIWQDGVILADPNSSADLAQPTSPTSRTVTTAHVGADRDYDISGLLSNSYMAIEYYSDLSSTPPTFRTGTASCGVLVLWTRVPMEKQAP
jgi:hypothetical protein